MKDLLDEAVDLLFGCPVRSIGHENEFLSLRDTPPAVACRLKYDGDFVRALKARGYRHAHEFFVIPSRRAPRWLLPVAGASTMLAGTNIYMPHKRVPRAIKRLLVEIIKRGWKGSFTWRLLIASREPWPLQTLVASITGHEAPLFAVSFGRRPTVRKMTVQAISESGRTLGYIKLPLTSIATERVRHEAGVLERLWNYPELRPHIPRPFYAGPWLDRYLLFESALPGELGPKRLTSVHNDFLQTLWRVMPVMRSGDSIVDDVGRKWRGAGAQLNSQWSTLGHEVLQRSARELRGASIPCGISHGDFAPWNTRVSNDTLLLYDWESTQWDAPTRWDPFHFELQTAVSFKMSGPSELLENTATNYALYLLYLLSSVPQFLEEDNQAAITHRYRLLSRELRGDPITVSPSRPELRKPPRARNQTRTQSPVASGGGDSASERVIPRIVTMSWDDGDPRDMRIAELLQQRQLKATFYVPLSGYLKGTTLSPSEIRCLSDQEFEIGAHSVSHESLTQIKNRQELCREVSVCKNVLEDLTGKEIQMFCYPNGRYNAEVIEAVRSAGYKGARTTQMLSTALKFKAYEIPTTVQAYPHQMAEYLRDLGRAKNVPALWKFTTQLSSCESWLALGKRLFEDVMQYGGIWHLYGHSWEIDDINMWDALCEMLDHVAGREDVTYAMNCELLSADVSAPVLNGACSLPTTRIS